MRHRTCKYGLLTHHKLHPPRLLPLMRVHLNIQTKCLLATIEAELEYQNDSSSPVEVEFVMPMESVTVVTELTIKLGGRVVKGVVRGKEEAKDDYDDAITSGQTAVYGEQKGNDVFRMLLGNLPAGGRAELRLSLLQEMQREEGDEGPVRFNLPTTLKPRFCQGGPTVADNSDTAVEAAYELIIAMKVEYVGGLSKVESSSHLISTGVLEGGVWQVQLIDPKPLVKDFVVYLFPIHPAVPSILWGHPTASSQEVPSASKPHPFSVSPALMLSFLPQFSQEDKDSGAVASEIIFVIDRSGSMGGEPINSARATLELLIRSLSPGCAFNIVGFGTMYRLLFPDGSRRYDAETLQKATEYASKMKADMMGTNVLAPLEEIYRMRLLKGLSRQVIILTDGAVGNTGDVLKLVQNNSKTGRVFSIGIGSGVSSELVRGLAEAGGGRAVFVREGERMQGKILRLLSDAMSPCLTDVELRAPKGVQLFPSKTPSLFPNDRLVMYGLIEDSSLSLPKGHKLSMSYKMRDKLFSHELSLDCSDKQSEEGPWIHKLACSAVLREWEQTESRRSECIQLSCDANIVCVHTALVGVDTEGGNIVEGSMQHIKLKLRQPESYYIIQRRFCANTRTSRGGGGARGGGQRSKEKSKRSNRAGPDYIMEKMSAPISYEIQSDIIGDAMDSDSSDESMEVSSTSVHKKMGKFVHKEMDISGLSAPGSGVSPHEQLISQQTAEGYWEAGETVRKILNLSEQQRQACPEGMSEREWTTLLCLVALERYSEYEDEWKLVAKKGWRWLRGCKLSVNLEEATLKARETLK